MASLLALALLVCAELTAAAIHGGRADHATSSFDEFVQAFNRPYRRGSLEYQRRQAIFEGRLAEIKAKNMRPAKLWTAGVNSLTDRTDVELTQLRGWRGRNAARPHSEQVSLLRRAPQPALPKNVSWLHLNASKNIKEQGGCGSCWAITAASVLEAHHEIKRKEFVRFSAQELVSCVPNPDECGGQGGCKGATIELAMKYVTSHGLAKEDENPYKATDLPCKSSLVEMSASGVVEGVGQGQGNAHTGAALGMTGWTKLPENQMEPLMRAALEGPVGVSVSGASWSYYNQGIFDDCDKDATIDHAVTLVGFGEEEGTKYWTIQNSWGHRWGEAGHIRLFRHDPKADDAEEEAHCGTDREPELGSGCKGGPSEVHVCGMCGILYDTVQPHFDAAKAPAAAGGVGMVQVRASYSNLRSKALA